MKQLISPGPHNSSLSLSHNKSYEYYVLTCSLPFHHHSHTLFLPFTSSSYKNKKMNSSNIQKMAPSSYSNSYMRIKKLIADDYTITEEEEETEEEQEMEGKNSMQKKKKGSNELGEGSAKSNGQMIFCVVENCGADLRDCKQYHQRHKVCELHAKAVSVMVGGFMQRFCQQCSRFHELSEFDDTKRSCRRRLAGHNERRRKSSLKSCKDGRSQM